MVGEMGVGKTSLVRRFVTDRFDDRYIATVGTKITKKSVDVMWKGLETTLDMTIWDIMGDKGFRQLLKEAYFHGAQGVIAVCDLTRPDTLFDLNGWINTVIKQVGEVPMCFVGNKNDLKGQKAINVDELAKISQIHETPYFITSAKTGENVETVFGSLSQTIADRYSTPKR